MNTEYEIPLKIQIPFPHFDTFKWVKIREILNKFSANKITDFPSFEKDLQKLYNLSKNISPMKSFKILEIFFSKNISITEKFFKKTLSFLSNLALELPTLLPKPLPLLLQNTSGSLTFTKKQIACLIIHMFFGTITNSHGNPNFHEVINFGYILSNKGEGLFQKIGFLFNYFDRLVSGEIDFNRNISYVRIKGKKKSIEYWYSSKKNLNEVKILDIGGIEDIRPDTIQVDFANKYIGGGALLDGCVQEEIRFIINPECLPSMIIFECFKSDEVGYIIGTEQFCRYKGYGWDFAFDGNFEDKNSKLDSKKRMDVNILALDAICFYAPKKMEQFDESNLFREVNKAYIGFNGDETLLQFEHNKQSIATGRWGCGAFNGISQLKFLIQWIAASECDKDIIFYRREDKLLHNLEKIVNGLKKKNVGEILEIIKKFNLSDEIDLFEFIIKLY